MSLDRMGPIPYGTICFGGWARPNWSGRAQQKSALRRLETHGRGAGSGAALWHARQGKALRMAGPRDHGELPQRPADERRLAAEPEPDPEPRPGAIGDKRGDKEADRRGVADEVQGRPDTGELSPRLRTNPTRATSGAFQDECRRWRPRRIACCAR